MVYIVYQSPLGLAPLKNSPEDDSDIGGDDDEPRFVFTVSVTYKRTPLLHHLIIPAAEL